MQLQAAGAAPARARARVTRRFVSFVKRLTRPRTSRVHAKLSDNLVRLDTFDVSTPSTAGRWQEKLSGQKLGGEVVLIPGQKNTISSEAQARPTGTGVGVVTPPAA